MIFLSASLPTPGREFYGTENVYAIREAVMAFTYVCAKHKLPFYFGGHPAITPLIWDVAKDYSSDIQHLFKIYQSAWFKGQTPKEVAYFDNIVWTKKCSTLGESVKLMRFMMFNDNPTDIAVFLGGMNGILDEEKMIHNLYKNVKILPIPTTGAASKQLYDDLNLSYQDIEDNYGYISIFEKYLTHKKI